MTLTEIKSLTKPEIVEQLNAANLPFDANANKDELAELLEAHYAANAPADPANDPANDPADDTPVKDLSALFGASPVRLSQENFENVEIGTAAEAVLLGSRKTRDQAYWLGRFEFKNYGTVTSIIGGAGEFTLAEILALKGGKYALTYIGQSTITTREGSDLTLPRFAMEF